VQQQATRDGADNVRRGLRALETAAAQGARLVCYAELAFEWFYPQRPAGAHAADLAESVPGPITEAFARRARQLGIVVVLNLYERGGTHCYGRSPVIDADRRPLRQTPLGHLPEHPG